MKIDDYQLDVRVPQSAKVSVPSPKRIGNSYPR